MISFNTTEDEMKTIIKIIDRACMMSHDIDRLSLDMDLSATHACGCKLDFEKLLAFDDFSFAHDIGGIMRYLDRTTGKLQGCFLPRCAL